MTTPAIRPARRDFNGDQRAALDTIARQYGVTAHQVVRSFDAATDAEIDKMLHAAGYDPNAAAARRMAELLDERDRRDSEFHYSANVRVMTNEYRSAFDAWAKNRATTAQKAVLIEARDQSSLVGSAGGFLVPRAWADRVLIRTKLAAPMVSASMVVDTPTDGRPLDYPILDDTGNDSGPISENTTVGNQQTTFATVALGGWNFPAHVRASWQLDQDAGPGVGLDTLVPDMVAVRVARAVNHYLTVGNGTAQPTGILNAPPAGQITTEITGHSTGYSYTGLVNCLSSLDPSFYLPGPDGGPGAAWMMSKQVALQLAGLNDMSSRPLLTLGGQDGDNPMGAHGSMLGFPVLINSEFPQTLTASTVGIAFGDFRRGYVVRRGPITLTKLVETHADQLQVAYAAVNRYDGAPGIASAIVYLKTSAS